MLLSVIIPAYNAENYIDACLRSCYDCILGEKAGSQRLAADDVEIIVVDDGSTDKTPLLLQQWEATHNHLRVLHQQNQGQSVARNLAIESAQGDYLYMVDADDAMMGPLPISVIRQDRHDIVAVQVMYQPEQGERRPWSHQMEHWPFDVEFSSGADFVRRHNIEGLVYGYLFRRSLFTDHPELRFTPGIYHQDEELIFKIFTLAGPTIYKQGYTYLYYEHNGSSLNTRSAERKRKLMEHHLIILQRLIEWRDKLGLQEVMRYKMAYLSMDALRILIQKRHDPAYAQEVILKMSSMGLYPLPWLAEVKYCGMKLLTCRPWLISLWLKLRGREHQTGD